MYTHGCTVHLISLFSVSPTLQSRRVRHHVGCSTNSGKWTGTNIIYKTTRHQTLNILNNCVKVFVVVMRKEKITKTISYLTKKPRSKCHLTESFWELPRCSVWVTTGSWQTQFSQKKKKRGGVVSRLTGGWRRSGSAYNELHNSASNLSPFPPRLSSLVFI